jgi:hypothetical protein
VNYEVTLAPQAEEDLAGLPPPLQQYVEQQLLRLAADPLGLGRRSVSPPYPPRCQLFQPSPVLYNGRSHEFTILFRCTVDETALQIIGIGHIRR